MPHEPKYWLVAANWGGDDMTPIFTQRGYWEMGYDDSQKPDYAQLRQQMQPDDRIAIKARGGRGASYIIIKALGIIHDVDQQDHRVYVRWLMTDFDRRVPSKGKFRTIHPPLDVKRDADRVNAIFRL
jgi:hypothetical protein